VKRFSLFLLAVFILVTISAGTAVSKSYNLSRVAIDEGEVAGARAVVSFHLASGSSPEMLEMIKSGIDVKFEYEVVVERVYRAWFNPTVGKMRIKKRIKYDPIQDEYSVTSSFNEKKVFYHDPLNASKAFFGYDGLVIPLERSAKKGERFEISVRARLDEVELSDIFRHIPFVSSWFQVKTDWTHLKVNAR
jgi:hypothetical protein